jgi:hypothetical protein
MLCLILCDVITLVCCVLFFVIHNFDVEYRPKSIRNSEVIEGFHKEYLYFEAIRNINQVC